MKSLISFVLISLICLKAQPLLAGESDVDNAVVRISTFHELESDLENLKDEREKMNGALKNNTGLQVRYAIRIANILGRIESRLKTMEYLLDKNAPLGKKIGDLRFSSRDASSELSYSIDTKILQKIEVVETDLSKVLTNLREEGKDKP
ncbi:MAG: hypothetical protein JWQ35_2684 [Bacteriovoracaceae bacterium]|nr:hypothetical protein [Bacteriovoracaceae bacterium]